MSCLQTWFFQVPQKDSWCGSNTRVKTLCHRHGGLTSSLKVPVSFSPWRHCPRPTVTSAASSQLATFPSLSTSIGQHIPRVGGTTCLRFVKVSLFDRLVGATGLNERMTIHRWRLTISTQINVYSQRQVLPQTKNRITSGQHKPQKLTPKTLDRKPYSWITLHTF